MTITDNKDIFEVGYTYDSGTVCPTRPEDTAFFMKALSGGGQVVIGGAEDNKDTSPPHNTAKVDVSDIRGPHERRCGGRRLRDSSSPTRRRAIRRQGPHHRRGYRACAPTRISISRLWRAQRTGPIQPRRLPGDHGILGGDSQNTADDFTVTASVSRW